MSLGFFDIQLGILAAFCGIALLFERYGLKQESEASSASRKDEDDEIHLGGLLKATHKLGLRYLGVYAVVMGQSAYLPDIRVCR
jgi:hypothetical protein